MTANDCPLLGVGVHPAPEHYQHVSFFFFNLGDLTPRSTPELYSYFSPKGRNTKKQPPSSEPVYILESLRMSPATGLPWLLGQILLTVHVENFTPINSKKITKSKSRQFSYHCH